MTVCGATDGTRDARHESQKVKFGGSKVAEEPVAAAAAAAVRRRKMGVLSVDLLVTLQVLPGFFSNCLFLVLYDSVVLLKRVVSLLSCSGSGGAEWQRMLTSAGLRSIWNSFMLDAYKQVKLGEAAPNSKVVRIPRISGCHWNGVGKNSDECHLLDFESSERPLVVNFGSAT